MQAETIRENLHARPFRAFTVHTINGETYLVDHPSFGSVTRGGAKMIISLPDGEGERLRWLETAVIDRLEKEEFPEFI